MEPSVLTARVAVLWQAFSKGDVIERLRRLEERVGCLDVVLEDCVACIGEIARTQRVTNEALERLERRGDHGQV